MAFSHMCVLTTQIHDLAESIQLVMSGCIRTLCGHRGLIIDVLSCPDGHAVRPSAPRSAHLTLVARRTPLLPLVTRGHALPSLPPLVLTQRSVDPTPPSAGHGLSRYT